MLRKESAIALSALALVLGGCGVDPRKDASTDIAKFLDALRRDDATAFEAALDRPALRSDLRDQLTALGRASGVDVNGGPSEFAMDRMITPQTVSLAAAQTALPTAPTTDQVRVALKRGDKAHVCLPDRAKARCVLSFAKRGETWRLAGMQAPDLTRP